MMVGRHSPASFWGALPPASFTGCKWLAMFLNKILVLQSSRIDVFRFGWIFGFGFASPSTQGKHPERNRSISGQIRSFFKHQMGHLNEVISPYKWPYKRVTEVITPISYRFVNKSWRIFLLERFWGLTFWDRDTVDGSEIPFPTTVWMVLKPVVNNGISTTKLKWWVYRISGWTINSMTFGGLSIRERLSIRGALSADGSPMIFFWHAHESIHLWEGSILFMIWMFNKDQHMKIYIYIYMYKNNIYAEWQNEIPLQVSIADSLSSSGCEQLLVLHSAAGWWTSWQMRWCGQRTISTCFAEKDLCCGFARKLFVACVSSKWKRIDVCLGATERIMKSIVEASFSLNMQASDFSTPCLCVTSMLRRNRFSNGWRRLNRRRRRRWRVVQHGCWYQRDVSSSQPFLSFFFFKSIYRNYIIFLFASSLTAWLIWNYS